MSTKLNTLSQSDETQPLSVECLEERMMLSTVDIFAAGTTGDENLDIFIDQAYVTTFESVGGNVDSRDFVKFTFETDQTLSADQVSVAFGNDFFDPANGIDRNLVVDRIVLDGVTFETEAASTHSTGIWRNGLTGPGNFETEVLNINSIFIYSSDGATQDANRTRIRIDAQGQTGDEIVSLFVDDTLIENFTFASANTPHVFFTDLDRAVDLTQVRIEFQNDFYDPANGIDRNVFISQFQTVNLLNGDRNIVQTTDSRVFSSGTYFNGSIDDGFGRGSALVVNGFFEFRDGSSVQGRSQAEVLAEFDSLTAGSNPQFFLTTFDGFSDTFQTIPNEFFDNQGREYLVGGSTTQDAQDLLIVRLLSDGTVDPTFGNNGLSITPLEEFVFPATDVTIENFENGGGIGPTPVTQSTRSSVSTAKLAFNSNDEIAVALDLTVDDTRTGNRINRLKQLGNQILRLDANGNADTSFSGDGSQIIEFVEGQTVRLIAADFDANDQLLLIGRKVDPVTTFTLGTLRGVADTISTLQLTETSAGQFSLVDVTPVV